jgi:DNA-binding NarL/FixJ family response regulator
MRRNHPHLYPFPQAEFLALTISAFLMDMTIFSVILTVTARAKLGSITKGRAMAHTGLIDGRARVAVVDDDEYTRLWLTDILQSQAEFAFAGAFSSASEALALIPRLQPDLALMDIGLPDLDGIECTKRLRQTLPQLKIIMISGRSDANWLDASMAAGAASFLIKPVEAKQILATLRFAAADQKQEKNTNREKDLRLSPREKEVLAGLAEGLLYKEISQKLGISYSAVHKYQHNIFKKLAVSNRSEAIRAWYSQHSRNVTGTSA